MSERRVSGWFILSAIFITLVFGLFFTFTERKSWPEHRIELGPMDMRLIPPVSTLWCEAVALHSDHTFVAYQVNQSGQINPLRLTSQIMKLGRKTLGRSWFTNFEEYKYFLLPASVIEIVACSWYPEVKLLVFKGDTDVLGCLQNLHESMVNQRFSQKIPKPFAYDSSVDTSEEDDSDYKSEEDGSSSTEIVTYKKVCSSLLHSQTVDLNHDVDSLECSPYTKIRPIKVNITSADYYVIAVWNANPEQTNYVNLRVMLDRTRYVVQRSGQAMDICSMSKTCTIGLNFASGDRVLVSVPDESNAGRSTVVIRSRCKPRLAVFAVLSVFLPLLLFLVVAFVVRADRQSFGKYFCKRRDSVSRLPNSHRIISPLLDDRNACSVESLPGHGAHSSETATVLVDDMPPPYHTLYDPPPPYACVNSRTSGSDQTRRPGK